jgi:hypothetical protein
MHPNQTLDVGGEALLLLSQPDSPWRCGSVLRAERSNKARRKWGTDKQRVRDY